MLSSSGLQGRELQTHSRILRRGSISPPPPLWTERLDLSFIGGGPRPPIIALSPSVNTARKLSLVWGVHSVVTEDAHDLDDMVSRACRISFKEGFAKAGERVIIVCGVPLGTPGATNMLRIAFVGGEDTGD